MKKRQLTGVLLCAALAAGMLAGCGQKAGTTETAGGQTAAESQKETQGEKKAKGVTITVGFKASHVEISNIETFKKGWEEATGNTVDVQAIDDDQFDLFEQLAVWFGILEKLMDASALKAQVRIVRQDGIKRKFEEAVHRASSGIDCGNAGRSKNDIFLFRIGTDMP